MKGFPSARQIKFQEPFQEIYKETVPCIPCLKLFFECSHIKNYTSKHLSQFNSAISLYSVLKPQRYNSDFKVSLTKR